MTDYKRVADGKREIPISSCPSYVEDLVYGTGSTLMPSNDDEDVVFQATIERLDEKAKKYCPQNKPRKKQLSSTRYDKIKRIHAEIGDAEFFYPTVDTQNRFVLNNKTFWIDEAVSGYCGKQIGSDDILYDMDKIICAISRDGCIYYFDMNMDSIPNEFIHSAD